MKKLLALVLAAACAVSVTACAAKTGGEIMLPAKNSGILSVFCLGADAEGVTIEGAQYPLADAALTADFPLGVSNHFTGKAVRVAVRRGCLLIGICDKE